MPFAASNVYNLSFTSASLRPELARIVAECYLSVCDWQACKKQIVSANALQCRTANSAIRLERELRHRLETLTSDQIALLAHATAGDRAALAWLAAFKRIRFAFDFAAEVLRDKLAAHDFTLRPSDYEAFLDNKAVSHPELARVTETTKRKVRQVLLNMLTEAGLLVEGTSWGTIQRPVLSPAVLGAVTSDHSKWLAGFLFPDIEIARL